MESALYAAMARAMGRPVLLRIGGAFDIFHGQASATEQRLIAMVLKWPDVVIAQSVFARNYIRHAGRRGDIVLLPNWSAIPDAMPADRPATRMPVCLFIAGQEAHRKGIEEVLQAAALLKAQGCSVRFHLVAVPPPLMARITALDVGGSMEMEGPAAHGRVLELMRQSDIFLLPSHGEGFPNALVEAMAAGMACIATPVGAVPEMAEGGAVLTVPVGNPASLASAIATLATTPRCGTAWPPKPR